MRATHKVTVFVREAVDGAWLVLNPRNHGTSGYTIPNHYVVDAEALPQPWTDGDIVQLTARSKTVWFREDGAWFSSRGGPAMDSEVERWLHDADAEVIRKQADS